MMIAFLDLLGFSDLLEKNEEFALNNLNEFNEVLKNKYIDYMDYKVNGNKNGTGEFAECTGIISFDYLISISDSLIIGGNDINLFIKQLMGFVASIFIYNLKTINDDNNADEYTKLKDRINTPYLKRNPIMFRGGVAIGTDVDFFDGYLIKNNEMVRSGLNVTGSTYLKAVKLEKSGKGPRLFCDKSVVDSVDENIRKYIKKVDEEKGIYEIVWTIIGCEVICSNENKWNNVLCHINNKMLPMVISLYNNHKGKDTELHYEELLKLVCEGIAKYANDKCKKVNCAIELINKKLPELYQIDISFLDDYII